MQQQNVSSKAEKFFARLESGDYQKAINYYKENIQGNFDDEFEAEQLCNNFYQYINEEFLAGRLTTEQAEKEVGKLLRVAGETYINYGMSNDDRFYEIKESKDYYALGCNAYDSENYLKAYEYLAAVITDDCNYDDAQTKRAEIIKTYKAKALADSKAKADEKDYPAACDILTESKDLLGDDIDIQSALDNYENLYVKDILAQAEAVFITPATDWEPAIDIIMQAQQHFSENQELKDAEAFYNKFRPVDITTLESYAQSSREIDLFTNGIKDTLGNRYESGLRTLGSDPSPYAVYDLKKEYNTFSAIGFVESGDKGYAGVVYVKIYCDGELLFSKKITSETKPYNINLDITGVQDLKIELTGSFNGWDGMYATIGNVMLQRTVK